MRRKTESSPLPSLQPLRDAIRGFTSAHLANAILRCQGNRARAARALGVTDRWVYKWIAMHPEMNQLLGGRGVTGRPSDDETEVRLPVDLSEEGECP